MLSRRDRSSGTLIRRHDTRERGSSISVCAVCTEPNPVREIRRRTTTRRANEITDESARFHNDRYFMSRLKKVKKANGQIIACNEVRHSSDRDEEHKALRQQKRPRARSTM